MIEKIIEQKELLLKEAELTRDWFIEKGDKQRAELQEDGIKEIKEFVKYLKGL